MVTIVAVTGANGFIASHVCDALVKQGYQVRAIVRNPTNPAKTSHLLAMGDSLSVWKGELLTPGSYDEAFRGVDVVIHCAAAVLLGAESETAAENNIVRPSVEGTTNVLASIAASGSVKRLVHTSSIAAIVRWNEKPGYVFTEHDWNTWSTVANGDPYGLAKTEAERLVMAAPSELEVVAINPGMVLGPCMTREHTKASPLIIRQCMYGVPQVNSFFGFVDVREVAIAHVRALQLDSSLIDRERFILVEGCRWLNDLQATFDTACPEKGISVHTIPYWKMLLARFGGSMSEFHKHVMSNKLVLDGTRASRALGIKYRPFNETVRDTVASMTDSGFIKPRL